MAANVEAWHVIRTVRGMDHGRQGGGGV